MKVNGISTAPGGSMLTPESLDAKLDEPVTMTRRKLAEYIHEGVMELNPEMQASHDRLEELVTTLEEENAELRREKAN